MSILFLDKPKRAKSIADWKSIQADGCPPGTYTPNMSEKDMNRWKAKVIGGDDPRVEIRKSTSKKESHGKYCSSQVLLIVRPDSSVCFSSNGRAYLDATELFAAIKEAQELLRLKHT
jgi:hypothetical protein